MNQPSDTFAQRSRRLTSEVQRLRDLAGGDPSRLGPVADALVSSTAHRLSAHQWADAAGTAQEAVSLSAKLLAQHGPVGPYTSPADAVRSITALVHLALIQSAAGLHAQAEQVLAAAFGLRSQLSRLDLDTLLQPRTVTWALLAWARAALADGRVADANSRIDAAVALAASDEEFLAIDVDRAASDARWAAGWPEPAVEFALRALERYDERTAAVLERPGSTPEAVLERLAEPLFRPVQRGRRPGAGDRCARPGPGTAPAAGRSARWAGGPDAAGATATGVGAGRPVRRPARPGPNRRGGRRGRVGVLDRRRFGGRAVGPAAARPAGQPDLVDAAAECGRVRRRVGHRAARRTAGRPAGSGGCRRAAPAH